MRSKPQGEQAISSSSPIGVFDSGVGGLTVLRALLDRLPGEDFVYLGDTARLPYGTKSPGSIRQYSLQAARLLHERGVKCLVVACNTASAIALAALKHEFDPVPVIGVLEPGAAAACRATRSGRIAVLATESTVRGGAYQAAITRRQPDAIVTARACPLFVALAEEGWTDGPIVEGVIHRYLDDVFVAGAAAAHPDTLLLGCTHFPVLVPALRKVLGPDVAIVDSAATTAVSLADVLAGRGVLRHDQAAGRVTLLATDGPERFARVGAVFLGRPLAPADVEIVDLPFTPAASGV
ncbi:MAG: glutamate racemase [Gammaproteobacteria bacterium]|nr:glutamate racemase [Gammaproteobacteria bacterium]MDH4311608.1 glutamate racemase [Gammaproteobacteria bacterium]MDH5274003.1 glutamate racemase [Gammaproteobacteria bacterium]